MAITKVKKAPVEQESILSKAKISITKSSDGATVETEEKVSEAVFSEPVCNVGMSAGFTRNMGNYNSTKVQVSLHVPCLKDDIDDAFEFVKGWVDSKLESITEDLDNA